MARFRSKDTKPELLVRRALHRHGKRFRLHRKDLPGRPDIVLPGLRIAVFVHGCFWHAHEGCRDARVPSSRPEFWREKFARNKERDRRAEQELQALGWQVVTIWECEAKSARLDEVLREYRLIGLSHSAEPGLAPALPARSMRQACDY